MKYMYAGIIATFLLPISLTAMRYDIDLLEDEEREYVETHSAQTFVYVPDHIHDLILALYDYMSADSTYQQVLEDIAIFPNIAREQPMKVVMPLLLASLEVARPYFTQMQYKRATIHLMHYYYALQKGKMTIVNTN